MRWLWILLFLYPATSMALLLQSPVKNTDKRSQYSFPSFEKKTSDFNFFLESSYIQNPLVTTTTFSGETKPVMSGLLGLDLGANYYYGDDLSLGLVIPMIKPQGTVESPFVLLGPAFEIRYKILDNLMIIPFYQLGSEKTISQPIFGTTYDLPLGAKNGVVGGRLVYDAGEYVGINWKVQAGMYQASENKFLTIDESSHTIAGISGNLPLADNLSLNAELNYDKTPQNGFIDTMGYFTYKGETWTVQTGAGTDLNMAGANTLKAFFGLTYNFGSEKKSSYWPGSSGKSYSLPKIPKVPKNKQPAQPLQEDDINEQSGPKVLEPEKAPEVSNPDKENSIYKDNEVENEVDSN